MRYSWKWLTNSEETHFKKNRSMQITHKASWVIVESESESINSWLGLHSKRQYF